MDVLRKQLSILEEEAMSRVGINMQVRVWENSSQLNAVFRRNQEIIVAVRNEDGHAQLTDTLVRIEGVWLAEVAHRLSLTLSEFGTQVRSAVVGS